MYIMGPESSFTLELVGYDFSRELGAAHDDRALRVEISVEHPLGDWSSVDARLRTTDVRLLAEWLSAVGDGRPAEAEFSLIEPSLSFRLCANEGKRTELRIYVGLDSRTKWSPARRPESDLWVQIPIYHWRIRAAAASLQEDLNCLPSQGPDS